jgi:3-deoxy-D-manno-octulosonic-acid transferase
VTNTGHAEAREISQNVRFLPYEILLPYWISEQKLLVVMEAELWYMLFLLAKRRGIPTMLINARVSDRSYPKYKKFEFVYKKIFENIDFVYAQSDKDKQRLEELGAKNVQVCGNIKIATDIQPTIEYKKPQNSEIITAGSTHKGEEEIILDSFLAIKDDNRDLKLIIVPRHPERFDEVDEMIKEKIKDTNLLYHRFAHTPHFDSDIILVDKMGELINIYAISDTVLLAGSFMPNIGGHNPIEAAYFGAKVISGEHYFNQQPLYDIVDNIKVIPTEELTTTLKDRENLQTTSINQSSDISMIVERIKEYR